MKKWVIILLCLVILSGIFYVLLPNEKPIPHHNLVDTKITQYSDNHITQNAMATDPQFKNIAFKPVPANSNFFYNQIASVIKSIKALTASPVKENTKEYGSWVWTPVMSMTPAYIDSILSDAKANGVNTMYVSIDTYLDVFTMPKGAEREKQKKAYSDKLEYFISRAKILGLAVDAEAGWRNWAEGDNIYKGYAIVSFVKNFNATHEDRFRGFQYDVEPYLMDSYDKNKASVLENFVSLADQTQNFMATDTLKFSVVVPDFYDEKDGMTPMFSYNGKNAYVFRHLLDVLDKRPGSSIIIMSYRGFAEGYDGSIEISNNEMETARNGSYDTKIIIAQETSDVPPPYITFYKTSKNHFNKEIGNIDSAFSSYPEFGGIAVHYVNAFLALK